MDRLRLETNRTRVSNPTDRAFRQTAPEADSARHGDTHQYRTDQRESARLGRRGQGSGQWRNRRFGTSVTSAPQHDIGAGSAGETVARHNDQYVVPRPTEQLDVTGRANQHIVTRPSQCRNGKRESGDAAELD